MSAIRSFSLPALLMGLCVGCGGKPSEAPSPEAKNEYKGSKGGPPGGLPAPAASAGIEGDYLVVGREMLGVKDKPENLAKETEAERTVKITKDTISFMMFKKEPVKVTYKLDPAKSPAEIDVTAEDHGKTQVLHGIYKVEGDTLTLYIIGTKEAKNRPKEFKTEKLKPSKKGEEQDVGVIILTLKKKSDESASAPPPSKSPPTAATVGTGRSPKTSK